MSKSIILITGANGEMGHGLISELYKNNHDNIVALDINKIDNSIKKYCFKNITGNILDSNLINQLNREYKIDTIYHLAAVLSTKAEKNPQLAHNVNVNGTLNMLELALKQGEIKKKQIKFFFPSSIAIYGLNDINQKLLVGSISENTHHNPLTMYGCNKLYCEHLGSYYQNMDILNQNSYIDFRSIRFPGIISSKTIPTSGTSDYIPEMLHSAAKGIEYECFVRKNTKIPFMTMPDAIFGITKIMNAPKENLKQNVFNIRAFAPTAEEFRKKLLTYFPKAKITYKINTKRQRMLDGWPMDTNDQAAQNQWGWEPIHNLDKGLSDYLIPDLKLLYS